MDRELLQHVAPLLRLEAERHRVFVAHLVQEVQAHRFVSLVILRHVLLAPERRQVAQGIAAGRFDLDHLGAQFGELRRAPVADHHAGRAVEHADAPERLGLLVRLFGAEHRLEKQRVLSGRLGDCLVDLLGVRLRHSGPRGTPTGPGFQGFCLRHTVSSSLPGVTPPITRASRPNLPPGDQDRGARRIRPRRLCADLAGVVKPVLLIARSFGRGPSSRSEPGPALTWVDTPTPAASTVAA